MEAMDRENAVMGAVSKAIAATVLLYEDSIIRYTPRQGFFGMRLPHNVIYAMVKNRADIKGIYPEIRFLESGAEQYMPKHLKAG